MQQQIFYGPMIPTVMWLSRLLGDILLNVNGVDLTGVTRSEAVANLKNTSSPVVLRVLEMRPPNESSLDCMPPLHSPCALSPSSPGDIKLPPPNDDYSPLWVSWLQLPRYTEQNTHKKYTSFYTYIYTHIYAAVFLKSLLCRFDLSHFPPIFFPSHTKSVGICCGGVWKFLTTSPIISYSMHNN